MGSKQRVKNSKAMMAIFAVVLYGATYALGSWAIDNGSLILYGLCIASFYGALRCSINGVKQWIKKDDVRRKAKKA